MMGTVMSVSPSQKMHKLRGSDVSSSDISYGSLSISSEGSSSSKTANRLRKSQLFFSNFSLRGRRGSRVIKLTENLNTQLDSATMSLEKSMSCFTISDQQESLNTGRVNSSNITEVKQHGAVHCKGRATISLLKKSETFPANLQDNNNSVSRKPKKKVIQASTAELLKCIGEFLCRRCRKIPHLDITEVSNWFRMVDRILMYQGWQDIVFINPANLVFIYMLLRDLTTGNEDEQQLKAIVLTCLYLSYSYMGNEISYPLKPFLIEKNRDVFWSRCVYIINKMSDKMLRINADPLYFTLIFSELKTYSPVTNGLHDITKTHQPALSTSTREI